VILPPRQPVRLRADWLVPVASPPVPDGAVLIGADGRIAAVGPAASVPLPPGVATLDFGSAALMPGLVNAHTHLELTGLAGRVVETDFSRWIRGVRELKAGLDADWFAQAARRGVADAFAAGITTVLDTGDSGAVLPALVELGGAGVVYQEVFGPDPAQCAGSIAALEERLDQLAPVATEQVRLGVSPHAPYTVSGPLYRETAALARRRGLPWAVHLAESEAETALVTTHRGPFAEAWAGRGIPPLERHDDSGPEARRSPVAWLDAHGVLGPATLCIHVVRADDADLALLAARGAAVAHCPVSNLRHGHGSARPAAMLAAGIRVGLGTDSVISVDRLDLFAEMRAARSLLGTTAAAVLALATRDGARVAGLPGRSGTLEPGVWADVVALDLPAGGDQPVEERIVATGPAAVRATFASGRPVYRGSQAP